MALTSSTLTNAIKPPPIVSDAPKPSASSDDSSSDASTDTNTDTGDDASLNAPIQDNTSPASGSDSDASTSMLLHAEASNSQQFISDMKNLQNGIDASRQNLEKIMGEKMPPPPVPLVPPPAPQTKQYNPSEAWGSAAMIVAGLGSLLTRRSMTNAINAGAAVMNAYKQGDSNAAAAAMETWKAETKNALETNKYEAQQYDNILKAHDYDITAASNALKAQASVTQDEVKIIAMNALGPQGAIEVLHGLHKATASLASASAETAAYNDATQKAIKYDQQHPQPADPKLVPAWHAAREKFMTSNFGQQQANSGVPVDPADYPDHATGVSDNAVANMVKAVQDHLEIAPKYKIGSPEQNQWNRVVLKLAQGVMQETPMGGLGSDPPPDSLLGQLKAQNGPAYRKAQAIATYRMPAPIGAGANSGDNPVAMDMVLKINPDYDAAKYDGAKKAIANFDQGPFAARLLAYKTLVPHIEQFRALTNAMQNGNLQLFNQLANEYGIQTGQTAVTSVQAASRLVGDEIVKAVTGTAGALADRDDAQTYMSTKQSPAQINGALDVFEGLAAAQLNSLREQYVGSTFLPAEDFDTRYLDPAVVSILEGVKPVDSLPTGAPSTSGGGKPSLSSFWKQ